MTSFRSRAIALFALLISLSAAMAFAQEVTGTISGTVKDSSGAVLPGAQVELLNQDTGIARTVQTDTSGHFTAPLLPLGNYSVTATQQGFQKEVRSGIVLTVGREAVVDMTMAVGAITQTVEVQGEVAQINTTTATLQGLVAGEQIRELPLNGRSYNDLALLNPGVIYDRTTGSSSSDGFGVRMSVNGARANNNLFLIDGTNTNDKSQTGGTVNADSMGVEAIREFAVLTHNYPAEFGHSAGGIVNAVTRSGTNQFHGSLYEFMRNSDVDARDFFQVGNIAPFRRNQFGGSIGGPVKKDKVFFFGNYEGFRQSLGIPVIGNVPDAQARLGNLPLSAGNCTTSNGTFNNATGLCHVGVSPLIAPYLALYAQPNGADNGDGTAIWNYNFQQPINENYYMERVDFHLSDKDNLYARYIFDPSNRLRQNTDPYWSVEDEATNHFAQIGETHIFSSTAINDFRSAFNRTQRDTTVGPTNPIVANAPSFAPGLPIGRVNFSNSSSGAGGAGGGLEVMGNLSSGPTYNYQNIFEQGDTFTLVRGKHTFKVGADLERYQTNLTGGGGGPRGSWLFSGIQGFLLAQPTKMDSGKVLGPTGTPGIIGLTEFGWRQWLPAWFVQDDWRITSRLTLNIGLRQEFFTDQKEVNDFMGRLENLTDAASTIGVTPYHYAKLNFAPRIGLAWDPTGSGKTSVRFGVGTYFNQVNQQEAGASDYHYNATYTLNCNWTGATNPCATFPLVPANPKLSTSKSGTFIPATLSTPTVEQYGLEVQRQITPTMMLSVGYVGWYGYHMIRAYCADCSPWNAATNLVNPNIVPNSNFNSISGIAADAHANYNSLQTVFKKALGAGLMLQVSYTYSKDLSQADSSQNRITDNSGQGYVTMIPTDLADDYGRSAYEQRELLVINAQYTLPFDRHLKTRMQKMLVGGWQLSGIWQYGSGLPQSANVGFSQSNDGDGNTPDRPNLNPGFSNSPTTGVTAGCAGVKAGQQLGTPSLWFDPCAFSLPATNTFGNLGRDTINGPRFNQVNFTVAKAFAFTERIKLQFRAEFFNIFNHPAFGLANLQLFNQVGTTGGTLSGSAGSMTDTTAIGLGGRNIQGGLKLIF